MLWVHVYVGICMYVHTNVNIHVWMYIRMYHTYVCMHACMHACYVYTYMQVVWWMASQDTTHTCLRAFKVSAQACMHTHPHRHAHTHSITIYITHTRVLVTEPPLKKNAHALGSQSRPGPSKRGRQRFFGAENAAPVCVAWRGVAATFDATSRCPLIRFFYKKTKLLGEGTRRLYILFRY